MRTVKEFFEDAKVRPIRAVLFLVLGVIAVVFMVALTTIVENCVSDSCPEWLVNITEPTNNSSLEDVDGAVESAITRKTFFISKAVQKNTVDIPIEDIIALCGDPEGCQLRLGMVNWDDTGRTASRSSLFYYNKDNRNWRSELGDIAGTDADNITTHPLQAWTCYFTDAVYKDGVHTDTAPGFGLLSWTSHNADCRLTILD